MKKYISDSTLSIKPSGIRKFFDIASKTPGIVSLGVGEPDFDTPWHIADEAIASLEQGKTFYTDNRGLLELREAASSFLKRKYGLSYSTKEILITVGASEAIDLSLRAIINPGDEVIIPDPGYVSYEPCVTLAHAKCVHLPLREDDSYRLDPKDLEKLITSKTKAIILNYPNNPTGAEMSLEDMKEIASICVKNDILVISDEIYSELTYEEKHISLASLPGMKERTIIINGFSKSYSMAGWRLGYLCAPSDFINSMVTIHQYTIMCPTTICQYAGVEALNNGDKDIERMREEYSKRRFYVLKRLKDMGLECFSPKGAFYVFPSIKKFNMSSEDFCLQLVEKAKVAIIPGSAFGENGEGHVRISYAYSLNDLKEALDRLESFIKTLN